jgi:hypothetical protein
MTTLALPGIYMTANIYRMIREQSKNIQAWGLIQISAVGKESQMGCSSCVDNRKMIEKSRVNEFVR